MKRLTELNESLQRFKTQLAIAQANVSAIVGRSAFRRGDNLRLKLYREDVQKFSRLVSECERKISDLKRPFVSEDFHDGR